MAEAKKTGDNKFVGQLKRSNSKIRIDRARRIGDSVSDAQEKLLMDIKGNIRKMEDKLDTMMDLSADNRTTTNNVISSDFCADSFVREINDLKTKIRLESIKLEIAQETKEEWF